MAVIRGLLVALCVTFCVAEKVRYDGYQVLRITPKTDRDVNILRNIQHSTFGEKLSFWKEPSFVNNPVDILVSPILRDDVVRTLGRRGIRSSAMIENLQELIDEEESNLTPNAFNYNTYNTYEELQQWITDTAASSNLATEGSVGTSHLKRNIGYIKISSGGSGKKAIVFHGGMHAREWITPATVIYMGKYLTEGSAEATELLGKFDFYIIPVMNPDGYAYTWSNDRMWRKTRKPNTNSNCVGTDPNRNFATGWGGGGSSGSPCSETYRGTTSFSEPETAALRTFMQSPELFGRVAMYSDYHAYSQYWMTPYGYTYSKPSNYATQYAGAEAACTALRSVHGKRYKYGSIISVIYQASGGSSDFMHAGLGVPYSYALEGRDTGQHGFQLPESQIEPSAEENWAALVAVCRYIYDNPQ